MPVKLSKNKRFEEFIAYFDAHLPTAETELHFDSVFHLLIAVILSAQCTDKRVNMTTPALFKKFKTAKQLANANYEDVFKMIRSISYPNSKANYLIDMSKGLMDRFNGEVPATLEELTTLPGVGRKTANVILAVAFKIPAMPVDTHVHRVSARIGLTVNAKTPEATEMQLVKHIPPDKLNLAHHWLILHGRYVCMARAPKCDTCGIADICSFYSKRKLG